MVARLVALVWCEATVNKLLPSDGYRFTLAAGRQPALGDIVMLSGSNGGGDPSGANSQPQASAQRAIPQEAWLMSSFHTLILATGVFAAIELEAYRGIDHSEILKQLYGLIFGGLGGTVVALRWVIYSVRHGRYDRRRMLWQLWTPLYSAVLAWVGVIAMGGGILVLGSAAKPVEPQFTYFIMTFSFLAGFASEIFSQRLMMAARTLFGEHAEDKEAKLKNEPNKKELAD